jgi:UDP-N-acetylmuramoyl-tripeptide--D-alanyl-D-alanine ligase
VVVTPGMVELGKLENEKNYEFGKKIAECADYVILIGEKKTKIIYDALIDSKYDKDNIFILNRVSDAYNVINALKEDGVDIYALFENDLPDMYMEGKK